MSKDDKILKEFTSKEYEHGWSVDFDVDQAPKGLNEDVIRLISSKRSKQENLLPMGYTDNVILKKDVMKDEFICLEDVELNLQKEIIEAREYQYNLI